MGLAIGAAVLAAPAAQGPRHFEIEASFEAAGPHGGGPVVAVRFAALDPDVNLNEVPAPRLELDEHQRLLTPRTVKDSEPPLTPVSADAPRYLDLSEPVRFPVRLAPDVAPGFHGVPAEVVYFYCSKRQGWCRRGSESVTIPLLIQ